MENQKHLFEMSTIKKKCSKKLRSRIEWAGDKFTIITDKGISVVELHNFTLYAKKWNNKVESFIENNTLSPATPLFKKYKKKGIPCIDFTELHTDPALWPNSPQLLTDHVHYVISLWSPLNFLDNNHEHFIATLTFFGQVDFYSMGDYNIWKKVLDLSSVINEYSPMDDVNKILCLKSLRDKVLEVETSAICWGHIADNVPASIYFAIAQKNGDIIFWLLENAGDNLQAKYLLRLPADDCEIITLFWYQVDDESFLIIYGNINGLLQAKLCNVQGNQINVIKSIHLWKDPDRMEINDIICYFRDEKIYIAYSKYKYGIIQTLDKLCEVESQHVMHTDYKITALLLHQDELYMATSDIKIFKVHISNLNGKYEPRMIEIPIKDKYPDCELQSFGISRNAAIFTLFLEVKTPPKKKQKWNCLVTFHTTSEDILTYLIEHPYQSLLDKQDCIEVLYYKSMQDGCVPAIDYTEFYHKAQSNIYMLKIYLVIVKLYHLVKVFLLKNYNTLTLPEPSEVKVKEQILFQHCTNTLNVLLNKCENSESELTELEKDTIIFAKDYFNYYCKTNNVDARNYVNKDMLDKVNVSKVFVCQCCDERHNGEWYGSDHMNIMCTLSFSQINEENYLYCTKCKVGARSDLNGNNPTFCLFCDSLMKVSIVV